MYQVVGERQGEQNALFKVAKQIPKPQKVQAQQAINAQRLGQRHSQNRKVVCAYAHSRNLPNRNNFRFHPTACGRDGHFRRCYQVISCPCQQPFIQDGAGRTCVQNHFTPDNATQAKQSRPKPHIGSRWVKPNPKHSRPPPNLQAQVDQQSK